MTLKGMATAGMKPPQTTSSYSSTSSKGAPGTYLGTGKRDYGSYRFGMGLPYAGSPVGAPYRPMYGSPFGSPFVQQLGKKKKKKSKKRRTDPEE